MIKSVYNPSLFQLTRKQISLLNASSYYIVKVLNLLHNVPVVGTTRFIIYHPHNKEKPGMTKFVYNPFVFWPPLKLSSSFGASFDYCSRPNLSAALFLTYNNDACIVELGIEESPRTFLHLLFDALQLLSFMLSSILSKIYPAIFKYLAMSKYALMSK